MGDETRSFRFITLLNQATQPHHDHDHDHPFPDLELDEADMFYSSSSSTTTIDSPFRYHYDSPPSINHNHYTLTHRNFGLSAPRPVPRFGHPVTGTGPHRSAPHRTGDYNWESEERREDDEEEEEEIVPPHVVVARLTRTTSVLEGAGRTLKGRDLRRVRNAVWRKTGFLDL